jgi:hypothetical protein
MVAVLDSLEVLLVDQGMAWRYKLKLKERISYRRINLQKNMHTMAIIVTVKVWGKYGDVLENANLDSEIRNS